MKERRRAAALEAQLRSAGLLVSDAARLTDVSPTRSGRAAKSGSGATSAAASGIIAGAVPVLTSARGRRRVDDRMPAVIAGPIAPNSLSTRSANAAAAAVAPSAMSVELPNASTGQLRRRRRRPSF